MIASMQPLHAYPDDDTLKAWAPNVGPERAQRAWAWHSIQAAGGVLAFGSDWPVCLLATSYQRWIDTVRAWVKPLSQAEQARILGDTAVEAYGIS